MHADLDVRNRDANGTGLPGASNRVERHDRTGFAQSVAFNQRYRKPFSELFQYFTRQRRRATNAKSQGDVGRHRSIGQRPEKLRNSGQDRRLARDDFLNDAFWRVQGLDQHDGAAGRHRQHDAHAEHEAMKHRQQHHEPVERNGFQHFAATLDVAEQVGVGKHRPFGFTRGAGRVDDESQIGFRPLRECRRP